MTIDGPVRITRALAAATVVLFAGISAAADGDFRFAYLSRADDPYYEQQRVYTGLSLRNRHRPVDGARLALRESRIVGRSIGRKFELMEENLEPGAHAGTAIDDLIRQTGVQVFLLDLPLDDVFASSAAVSGKDVLLFNIRHREDSLRGESCSPELFHTIPSHAMLTDALAQFLLKKNWGDVLILEGQEARDKTLSGAFQSSARKFRLDVEDVRPFTLGNDPRQRGRNNIPILTRGSGYDVVFLADSLGEFGRYVPYNTQQARPVVGSEGLRAGAWHWTFERYGAPQLNQRFHRLAKRHMDDMDYAAWAAVKSVVEAVVRMETSHIGPLTDFLRSAEFTLDAYKGTPGNFRSWDNQLRQPILLNTHNAVVAVAPVEGFLHETNILDTLGTDHRESACRM